MGGGSVTDKWRIATALRRAAQILINEFSYNGEDPNGVKTYQEDVNYFQALASELVDKCEHPKAEGRIAYISRAMADAGFPVSGGIAGCSIIIDDQMVDNLVHFPQPDGTCYRVNA